MGCTSKPNNKLEKAQPKLEEPYVPELRFLESYVSEQEYENWRQAVFSELRQHLDFPELLWAVENFDPRRRIEWHDENGQPFLSETAPEDALALARVVEKPFKSEKSLHGLSEPRKRIARIYKLVAPDTAGELLALYLRDLLLSLKTAETEKRKGRSSKSPVRERGLLPRSTISELAMDLQEDCMVNNYAPGPQLTLLLRDLLDVNPAISAGSPTFAARYAASWIMAQHRMSARQLARAVGVKPSTAQGWLADPKFEHEVDDHDLMVRLIKRLRHLKRRTSAQLPD